MRIAIRIVEYQGLVWRFNDAATDPLSRRWANFEALGFLPGFLNADDPRSAREQFDAAYSMGGGWRGAEGAAYIAPHEIDAEGTMFYPGDPPLPWVAKTRLRDETILFYPFALVAIVQPDGSFVAQRMD